ncbi:MAG: response regulator [Elusimicrobiales bacterium]|nr:response regulator [Elusimicrobiales bacterium]
MSDKLPQNKLILIVDDEEGIRELLDIALKNEGFKTEKATTGKDAIEKIKNNNYDLILLDLMLPGYGGFEILRELQIEGKASIPVIIITGKYMDRSTKEMIKMEPNVVDLIEKPIKINIFISIVHKILKTNSFK